MGGLGGPSDGLIELGRLYHLRAKIQLKAAHAPPDAPGLTLPFQVGRTHHAQTRDRQAGKQQQQQQAAGLTCVWPCCLSV